MLRGSLTLAKIAGIPIRVHWTFGILLAWIFAKGTIHGGTAIEGFILAGFALAVFVCVILHELGHALTAKRFGVRTREIILLPIGGVATLERIPENPLQELAIAVAGPLVNVVIAMFLVAGLLWRGGFHSLFSITEPGFQVTTFLAGLATVNILLVLFNMIPAFPMDGGRVLRAILTVGVGNLRATRIAAITGQVLSAFMVLAGLFISPMLVLIGVFVWIAALAEASEVERRFLMRGVPVSAAMLKQFQVLSDEDSVDTAIEAITATTQHDFPVTVSGTYDSQVVGILSHRVLVSTLMNKGTPGTVGEVMCPTFSVAHETDPLESAYETMQSSGCSIQPVMRGSQLVGLLTADSIAEFLTIRSALATRNIAQMRAPPVRAE